MRRAAFGNEDDAGIEIALFAGDALIDRVRHHMGDAPPIFRLVVKDCAQHLAFAIDVPQTEIDAQPPVGLLASPAPVTRPCALITRQLAKLGTVLMLVMCST